MIELQYFTRNDFDHLINWVTSPEFLLQWAGPSFTYPLDDEQLHAYIADANHPGANAFIYKVVDANTKEIIGHISLVKIDRTQQTARIGRVLVGDPAYRGKGVGEQMIQKILEVAFDNLKLSEVTLGVFDFNKGAIKCYQKAGFKQVRLRKNAAAINHEYWHLIEMARSRSE
ncbi:GNAT family N-acetyltransferase [Tuberibacillus sp. Marseille-P3662]|uniref:GNAT family N-acetyltransferase n=1 Tax=Tuberibacillus sp. Marseille-P3662 TaxID=1965358 RepID=UPI000A1CC0EF|nr:GNAT family protein [Tuberibacillus sp. Marseille-P3662]